MAAALELTAKGADELARWIEYEDRGMLLQVFPPFVNDVEQALAVDSYIVGDLPGVPVRQLRPIMQDLVTVSSLSNDELLFRLLGGEDLRRGECGGGAGDEVAA